MSAVPHTAVHHPRGHAEGRPGATVRPSAPADDLIRFDPVTDAIAALREGLPVLVADDADRENEGDIILAAVHAIPRWVGWTIRHTSGVLCAAMPDEIADRLHLPPMVEHNEDAKKTAYTVSVDARHGVTTGISATDRSVTFRLLADPGTGPGDLVRPGHVFPLRAREGGVLTRRGHTEATVDLCRLAGLPPVGVLAEVVGDDGEVTRLPGLRRLADEHGLPLISIEDLAAYLREDATAAERAGATGVTAATGSPLMADAAGPVLRSRRSTRPRVQRVADTVLPTAVGTFRVLGYRDLVTGDAHVALVAGEPPARGALVRVHSECLTGDAFGSRRCDCGPQLDASLAAVAAEGGVVVYLSGHEGRGIGLLAKLTAYGLQDHGLDTVAANLEQGLPADAREYGAAAAVLGDLGLDGVRLLTNNPGKVDGLARHGITVADRVPLVVGQSRHNRAYLQAKRDLMGHALPVEVSDER
ncbi:MAG TPA: 3,4-dihydroxy-2-butanone-4-phosphate synthase [Kineosporiaceae bacterium]|nr:3,4-dihydroxy-2-butanone-4-phosphate synthase [Kineosporiaceae bacterium]